MRRADYAQSRLRSRLDYEVHQAKIEAFGRIMEARRLLWLQREDARKAGFDVPRPR